VKGIGSCFFSFLEFNFEFFFVKFGSFLSGFDFVGTRKRCKKRRPRRQHRQREGNPRAEIKGIIRNKEKFVMFNQVSPFVLITHA